MFYFELYTAAVMVCIYVTRKYMKLCVCSPDVVHTPPTDIKPECASCLTLAHCLQYIILAADNLMIVFPSWSYVQSILIATFVVLPTGVLCFHNVNAPPY